MNCKKPILLILLLSFLFISVACSTNEPVDEAIQKESSPSEPLEVPERNPDLMGRVKEVIGNEVTIIKMDPSSAQRMGQRAASDQQEESNSNELPPPNRDANANSQEQKPQKAAPQESTVQETEPFIIPVGTPIVMMQRGSAEPTLMDLTEIKKDQILRVWKYEGYVEFVQVIGGMRTGGNANTQRANQGGGFPGGLPGVFIGGPR